MRAEFPNTPGGFSFISEGTCPKLLIHQWLTCGQWWKVDPNAGLGSPDRQDQKPDYMLVVKADCGFNPIYYPVYSTREELGNDIRELRYRGMTVTMECYDLHHNLQEQLNRVICWAVPEDVQKFLRGVL